MTLNQEPACALGVITFTAAEAPLCSAQPSQVQMIDALLAITFAATWTAAYASEIYRPIHPPIYRKH